MELNRIMAEKFSLWIILLSYFSSMVSAQSCSGRSYNQYVCLKKGDFRTTWGVAQSQCAADGGRLVSIAESSKQAFVQKMMEDEGLTEIWIGLRDITSKVWKQSSSGKEIQPQGCYTDTATDRDLPVYAGVPKDELTITKCIQACRAANKAYAGTQIGEDCWCGDSFANYNNKLTTECRVTCAGDSTRYCGGTQNNYVYRTDGAYGVWKQSQPNNHGGFQLCAAMDSTGSYKFADEPCNIANHHVCNMPDISSSQCSREVTNGRLITVNNKCFFLSYLTLPWFDAQQDCWSRDGYLLELANAAEHSALATEINSLSKKQTNYYWIGVQRRDLLWQNGATLTYAKWRSGSPTSYTDECFKMVSRDNYAWTDVSCTSERASFICEYELVPTTVVTTAVATTTEAIKTTTESPTTATPTTILSPTTSVPTVPSPTTTDVPTPTTEDLTTEGVQPTFVVSSGTGSTGNLSLTSSGNFPITTESKGSPSYVSSLHTTGESDTTPTTTTTISTTTTQRLTTQRPSRPTTKSPTTSTRSSGRLTTGGQRPDPTIGTTSGGGIVPPSNQASTNEGIDENSLFIALIVLVSVLIILVVAAFIYMVFLRKKSKRPVHPLNNYDHSREVQDKKYNGDLHRDSREGPYRTTSQSSFQPYQNSRYKDTASDVRNTRISISND